MSGGVAVLTVLVVFVVVLAGCGGGSVSGRGGGRVVESAVARKAQAERLIDEVAREVVPGVQVRLAEPGPNAGPTPCTSPLKGQVYYSIFREFDAPVGKTGADLVPALRAAFGRHGFTTAGQEKAGDNVSFLGSNSYVGFNVLAYTSSRLVQVNLDTECGSPEPTHSTASSSR